MFSGGYLRTLMLGGTSAVGLTSGAWAQSDIIPKAADRVAAISPAPNKADNASVAVQEVVVTANRREEVSSRVAISITALTQATLDQQGVRSIADLTRIVPDVQIVGGSRGAGPSDLSIRGIASSVGAQTTGIYLDDTPLQVRKIGQGAEAINTFPQLFDLERVEVLRGPQGTLFGSGSEGGAIRFITPQPSLTDFTGYGRAEIVGVQGGGIGGEFGVSAGGPIVEDKLGFRVSAWYRRDPGYIDQTNYFTGQTIQKDANYRQSQNFRLSFAWAPTPDLLVTPSLFYQDIRQNADDGYWASLSSRKDDNFKNADPVRETDRDKLVLPALRVQWDVNAGLLGPVRLVSNTSYLIRQNDAVLDFTLFSDSLFGVYYPQNPNLFSPAPESDAQQIFTQEIRAQSRDPNARLTWLAGLFFSKGKQKDFEGVDVGDTDNLIHRLFGPNIGLAQLFGEGPYLGQYAFFQKVSSHDTQYAGFIQGDYTIIPKLKATAGVRITRSEFDFNTANLGPYNYPGLIVGGSQKETPITPKFGLSYQADDRNLFYGSIAKGFRPGGSQEPVPFAPCAAQLTALGITQSPSRYNSDSLWSYELGAKNKLFGGKVQLDSSVYHIDWSNIQQSVSLSGCGLSFITNLGSATSNGVDFASRIQLLPGLVASLAAAYTDATYDSNIVSGSSYIVRKGQKIDRSPISGSASLDYRYHAWGQNAYARADVQFTSRTYGFDPTSPDFDPALPPPKSLTTTNFRLGVLWKGYDISAFMNNALNAQQATVYREGVQSPLFFGQVNQPRTAGLTVTRRF